VSVYRHTGSLRAQSGNQSLGRDLNSAASSSSTTDLWLVMRGECVPVHYEQKVRYSASSG
jgi:hypothetical protein